MTTTLCNNDDKINIGKFKLVNFKYQSSSTPGCITLNDDNSFGWDWNHSASDSGWCYPNISSGDTWGSNTWPEVFQIIYKNINTFSTTLTWKFTKVPEANTQWNLAFDVYWVDSSYKSHYNIMIWVQGGMQTPAAVYQKDVSDGYNTYQYYKQTRTPGVTPWDGFVLKNRDQIPFQPVLNQTYSIQINIKTLMNAITDMLDGNWYIPGINLGDENSGGDGENSGNFLSSNYSLEINGNIATIVSTILPLTVSLSIDPTTIIIGQSVTFTTNVSGGTGPYIYSWSGLPTPCSGNTNSITCTPILTGIFDITVMVIDANRNMASSSGILSIDPVPVIQNLLLNSGFETDDPNDLTKPQYWNKYKTPWSTRYNPYPWKYESTGSGRDGIGRCVSIYFQNVEKGNNATWLQCIKVKPKTIYTISGYMKTNTSGTGAEVNVDWFSDPCINYNYISSSMVQTQNNTLDKWIYFTKTIISPLNVYGANLLLVLKKCTKGKVWFDDLIFK